MTAAALSLRIAGAVALPAELPRRPDMLALMTWQDWLLLAVLAAAAIAAAAFDCGEARADARWAGRMQALEQERSVAALDARLFAAVATDDASRFEALMRVRRKPAASVAPPPPTSPGITSPEITSPPAGRRSGWRPFPPQRKAS